MTSAKDFRIIENIRYYSSVCDLYYHCLFVGAPRHAYRILVFESSADMHLFKLLDPTTVANTRCMMSNLDLNTLTVDDIQGLLV